MEGTAASPQEGSSTLWRVAEEMRPYLKAVVRHVLQDKLADKLDSSDVVQESLLAAVRNFSQCRARTLGQWRAWLEAITRNEARNQLRFWHQRCRNFSQERPLLSGGRVAEELVSADSTPSERTLRRERAAILLAAIEQLDPDDQQVIRLRHFDGLSYDELAVRLGRTEKVVRQLWRGAFARLRKQLGDTV